MLTLRGFYDAEFVITDSFHACVFSIIFGKPFVVIGNTERGMTRFESLLKMFGLNKQLRNENISVDCNRPTLDIKNILHIKLEESNLFFNSII